MTLATRTLATGHRVLLVLNKRRCMHPRAKARGRRSNRPGNSQARGPRPEGRSDPCCHHHSSGPRLTISILPLAQKMVPFAGFEMPVQYPSGILNEHLHTRSKAGLFYVWHMGQLRLAGADPVNALNACEPAEERQSSFLPNGRWHFWSRHATASDMPASANGALIGFNENGKTEPAACRAGRARAFHCSNPLRDFSGCPCLRSDAAVSLATQCPWLGAYPSERQR